MELSSIELSYIVNYVNLRLTSGGYYLSQINAITKDSLALKFHHSTEQDILLAISTKGMWVTKMLFKQVEENDLVRNARKELERSRIISIQQLDSERITILKFEHHDNKIRYLICEFFGQGNIIICDESMKIISILNPLEVRHRTLRIGLKYAPPPSYGSDIFKISIEEFNSKFQNETKNLEITKWLGRILSLPKKFVEEILFRAQINDNRRKIKEITNIELGVIFTNTKKLVDEVICENKHSPVVIFDADNVPIDASHVVLKNMEDSTMKPSPTFMDALDEVLCNDIITIGKKIHTVELDKKISVLEHDLHEQDKAKLKVLSKSNSIRDLASDLMNISISDPAALEGLLNRHSAKLIMEKGKKYLDIVEELIPLDQNLRKVSSLLYERAKEMERGSETIDKARLKILDEIKELRKKTTIAENKIKLKEQKTKEWFERYRWFVTSSGLLVIGGRDASSNSAIIRKHMTDQDLVFHAEIHGSPFFLIKNIGLSSVDDDTTATNNQSIIETAIATVTFSRGWKEGLSSADAYWVNPNQVKKGAPTGQFLPKGSFVIEGKRNFVKALELKLAIGVTKDNDSYKVICGPVDSIKSKTIIYSIIVPGGIDPMNAAKKIKTELITNSHNIEDEDLIEFLKRMSLDDIIRILPSGKIKIASSEKGALYGNL